MAQKQDGLAAALGGEIHLQVVAKILSAMKLGVASQSFEAPRQKRAQAVDGLLVVAGRFDFHQLANGFGDRVFSVNKET